MQFSRSKKLLFGAPISARAFSIAAVISFDQVTMRFMTLLRLIFPMVGIALAQPGNPNMVPVPWLITGLSISNIRHGTGGL